MNLSLLAYVSGGKKSYSIRPLFLGEPEVLERSPKKCIERFQEVATKLLGELARSERHEDLLLTTFTPNLRLDVHGLELKLFRGRTRGARMPVASFSALGRRVSFCPLVPGLWWAVERGETDRERAEQVLGRHYREIEKKAAGRESALETEDIGLPEGHDAWVTLIEVQVSASQSMLRTGHLVTNELLGGKEFSGRLELYNVGKNLDFSALSRSPLRFRDSEVERVTRLLSDSSASVALLGPRGSGKTEILLDAIRRERERNPTGLGRHWIVPPARVIAGMSHVGDWERRWNAILDEVRRQSHVICFDDPAGLFRAGRSRSSDLTLGDVLKSRLMRGGIRVVVEATEETWCALSEIDRGFTDLFDVVRVDQLDEDSTIRVALSEARRIELDSPCAFDIDSIRTILHLLRRFPTDEVFPGAVVRLMRSVAESIPEGDEIEQESLEDEEDEDLKLTKRQRIDRRAVIEEFSSWSGLSFDFLDSETKLTRELLRHEFRERLVGQEEPIEAVIDRILLGRACVQEPERPIGVFLLLGPTGVGKTELAKATAAILFPNRPERLLRFDMNEYADPGAAARLVGTFYAPEGTLTRAIQASPVSLLLLDEIEKADPRVHDVLLGAIGEGRLTDGHGRTASLSQTIIMMTSNLGVREATGPSMGFAEQSKEGRRGYLRAAERFFRPEFFNRIDRVLTFSRLSAEETQRVAALQIDRILGRDGLLRRSFALEVFPSVRRALARAGHDSEMGARALKRELESGLVQPLADQMSATFVNQPCVVRMAWMGSRLGSRLNALEEAAILPEPKHEEIDVDELMQPLEALRMRLDDLRGDCGSLSPEHGPLFAAAERLIELRERIDEELGDEEVVSGGQSSGARVGHRKGWQDYTRNFGESLIDLVMSEQVEEALRAMIRRSAAHRTKTSRFAGELAWLSRIVSLLEGGAESRALLAVLPLADSAGPADVERIVKGTWAQAEALDIACEAEGVSKERSRAAASGHHDTEPIRMNDRRRFLLLSGPGAEELARAEEGVHLAVEPARGLVPVGVCRLEMERGSDPAKAIDGFVSRYEKWRSALEAGDARWEDDPVRPLSVVRVLGRAGMVDLRTGEGAGSDALVVPFVHELLNREGASCR